MHEKRSKSTQQKLSIVKKIHESKKSSRSKKNHFQITLITLDNNHLTDLTIEGDLHIKEIHKISHKIDIVDQTIEAINIEITTQDQIPTETTISLIPVPIQTLKIDIIQIIDLETPDIREIEIIPTIGTETIQMIEIIKIKITDNKIIQTTDQTIKDQIIIFITIDQAIFHKLYIQIIKTDR